MKTESATLMFGLVNIPVKITGTVRTNETKFRTLHAACSTPIVTKKWCPTCEVEALDTVKGVKVDSKTYRPIPDEQLEGVKGERSRIITITKFVPDNVFEFDQFYKHYHLIPDDKITDGYTLLWAGLEKKRMIGLGSACLWGKEHPVAIVPITGGLMLSLLHPVEDRVLRPYEMPDPPKDKSMVGLAGDLIDRQAGLVTADDLTSEARAKREALVDGILNQTEALTPSPSFDILSALRLSVGKGKVKA